MLAFKEFFIAEDDSDLTNDWHKENDNEHLGETSKAISKKLVSFKPIYNSDQHKAIARYIGYSNEVNNALIHKQHIGEHGAHIIEHLQEATQHPIGHEVHVYSGLGFDPSEHINKEHNTLHLPAFTSMTHAKKVATHFANLWPDKKVNKHILHIHLKPTDKALHVSHLSKIPSEHETILPHGTTLKVNPEPTTYVNKNKTGTHVWHAIVHHQGKI